MSDGRGGHLEILLVEDNPGDVMLTREAFSGSGRRSRIHAVSDGVEAMRFLRQEGDYADAPVPDLILLDLNMPRRDGREVMVAVKSDGQLCHIPIVVLTTSDADRDVMESYQRFANCYITKPADVHQYFQVIRNFEAFWTGVAKLPRWHSTYA